MDNAQWESKYNQLLVSYDEFQRSTRELEEDLESDLQNKEEQLLSLSRQLEKLKYDLSELQRSAEKDRHAAALQNDRLLAQVQVLKDSISTEKKVRVRLEQANEDLEGHLRILQRENEEATERLEATIEDQVILQQDYEDARRELQLVQEQLQKAEKLIEQLEPTSKVTDNVGDKALIDSLRAEIDALKQSKNAEAAAQPTARMRRLEGLQKIAKAREERLARKSVGKGPPAASNLIAKSGLLDKKEKSMESWKPQFCQINIVDRTLELFMVFFGTMEGGNVHKKVGSLRLPGCQLIVKRRGKRQFALQPSHSKNKTVFRCSSDEELEQWVEALQLGIVDVAQGPDATSFLRGRSRTQTLPKSLQGEGLSVIEATNDKQFVWQKENAIVKEGIAMKLKYGCEGNDSSDWDAMRLKLSLGSSVIEILSLQTTARGGIPLLVVEKGELGLTKFRTADSHGNQTNVMIAHSGAFEYVLQFPSVSDRMEWMRAIRFCTTPREHDVRLEGSLFLPGLKADDPAQRTYCTLLMSRVNPGIMNFFDAASNELVVVRCFRLSRTCVVAPCSDPCAFTLTQNDSVMLRARDAAEAKQWMVAISAILSELQDPNALQSRQSESKSSDDSVGPRGHSESFLSRPSVSEDVRLSHLSQSVDLSTRSKHGRLMEMNNSLIGASWKPRFFSLEANSRVLEYSPAGKKCVTKNCNALSEVSGGYCPQCMRKIMDGEDDEPKRLSSLSRTTSFLQRLGGNSMTKSSPPELVVSPSARVSSNGTIGERDVRKPHYIPLARATVAPLPPKKAGGRSHCFILTPHHSKRDYILQAADEQDLLDWVEVLSSRTKMEELPATSMRGLLSMRNVRATGTLVPWRPRWFVLENNVLIHRKSEHEKGGTIITLGPSCHVAVVEGQDDSSRVFEFCLTDSEQKETTHFQTDNKLMGKRWLAALERVIRHEQSMVSPDASSKPDDSPPSITLPLSPATLSSPPSSLNSPSPPIASTHISPLRSTRTRSSASPHPPPPPLIIEDTAALPPPTALTFDLSASRLETELLQQKIDLETQLRKREAELRQRDAELDEAKRLLIHLRAEGHTQESPETSLVDPHVFPAMKPVGKNPRKKLSFKPGNKAYLYREGDALEDSSSSKKKVVEEIRIIQIDKPSTEEDDDEDEEEIKLKKERERLEAENAQLKMLLLAEQVAKEKIREDLENERKKTEFVSKAAEEEKEKREREEAEKQRMKKELEAEKKRAKQILEEEAKKKKLKEAEKLNARLQQEDATRQMEAEKRRVHLENQWLLAEAEKQKLLREQAEKQREQIEKQKEQLEKQKAQAEKNSLQADKQRQAAENEKRQAEKQRLQSERQRMEAEADRKRLANEVGRRAHLQQQWMLAEQEKQKLIEEEKLRIAEAGKQLKEKELLVEAEKQRLEEKKKEGIERLLEQQRQEAEKKLMELKKQQEDAERERQRLLEEAEREKQRLREEAEKEKLLLQAELERQKQEQEENRKALEAEKERLRREAEAFRVEQERRLKEEHEKRLKEQLQEELEQEKKRLKEEQDKEQQFIFDSCPDVGVAEKDDKEHASAPNSPSSPPSSSLSTTRPTRLEVPRDADINSPSSVGSPDSEGGERGSRRTLRKAPPKFGTLQNLQKPIDVASLRNLFEVQERNAPSTPSRDPKSPPPPPPYHPDTPLPKVGQPPSSPLR